MRVSYRQGVRLCCSIRVCFLAFSWIISMTTGMLMASRDTSLFLLMCAAPKGSVTLAGLSIVLLLPLIILVCAILYNKFTVVYLLIATKAFIAGYLLYGLLICYGSAGWLVHALMFYSDSMMTIVLLWLSITHINGRRKSLTVHVITAFIAAAIIGITDYLIVSPFLCALFV